MTRRFRLAAFHLALAAMVLRALLPSGWMPSPTGEAAFVLCTMDGPVRQDQRDSGKHTPDDGHAHDECPFAAAPHLATPIAVAQPALPILLAQVAYSIWYGAALVRAADYQPQAPRAPPPTV